MEKWKNRLVLGFAIFLLLAGWSFWFWMHFPQRFTSLSKIHKDCLDAEKATEYCFGFEDGWKWADEQYQIQKAIDTFARLTPQEIEEFYKKGQALIPAFDRPRP